MFSKIYKRTVGVQGTRYEGYIPGTIDGIFSAGRTLGSWEQRRKDIEGEHRQAGNNVEQNLLAGVSERNGNELPRLERAVMCAADSNDSNSNSVQRAFHLQQNRLCIPKGS